MLSPMNITAADELEATLHFNQVILGKPYTGSVSEYIQIKRMLTDSQGSVGVEDALCLLLKIKKFETKHGFDAIDEKTGIFYELKPSKKLTPTATYNDASDEKIFKIKSCDNRLIFATIIDTRLIFVGEVDGQKLVELLEEKYLKRKAKIKKNIKEGKEAGTRQVQKVTPNQLIERFGANCIKVIYYFPHDKFNKNTKKFLNLTKEVNNLPA